LETCRNEWRFWECTECETVWLDPRPDPETLGTIYPPHYYSYNMESLSPIALRGKELLDRPKFRTILSALGTEPRSYLDVGCGDGRYLDVIAKRGVPRDKIFGLELSEGTVRKLRDRGYRVFLRRVEDCNEIPAGSIDLATMLHVIEHVADPLTVVRRIHEWLSPNGVLAVETPNIDAWDIRLFGSTWWGGYHIPRHWTLFKRSSLARLFDEAGFDVVRVIYETGHSFWAYSLHHVLKYNTRRPMPGLAKWFDPASSLPALIGFTGFDFVRASLGARTSAILMIARKRS
jgi:SAM-dependent methyltransferase